MIKINTPVKIVIGVAVLFLILMVISLFTTPPSEENIQNIDTIPTECVSDCQGSEACTHSCDIIIQNEAVRNKDILKCNEIADKSDKSECTKAVNAVLSESIEDCDNDVSCEDRFYFFEALAKNDKSYCDYIVNPTSKEVCINA